MDKKRIFWTSCLACVLAVSMSSLVEAQRFGGGGFRGGGGGGGFRPGGGGFSAGSLPRPGGSPNFSALQSNFGGGSVVHRDFTPNISRPSISPPINRPNLNVERPNLSGETLRNVERPNLSGETLRNVERPNLSGETLHNVDRPNLSGVTRNFGPDNRDQIFNRPGQNLPGHDGPDWKNWKDFNPQKINNTVVNKINVNNQSINTIRNNFNKQYNQNNFFNKNWYDNHPNAWRPGWGPGPWVGPGPRPLPPAPGWWWGGPTWNHAWGWFATGFFAGAITDAVLTPIPYAYGSNIVYQDDMVYVNSVPYVSADEYYQQAQDIANAGAEEISAPAPAPAETQQPAQPTTLAQGESKPADKEAVANADEQQSDWMPMGTFAVVADGKQTESKRILQLATNKQGQVRGNFINQETDKATELYGSVDPKTQRVAFKVQGNDSIVAECGLWNLTQDSVPMLVHLSKDRTEERTLVRLAGDKK